MKIGAAFPSTYLKAADLQGRTYQVQISGLKVENVGRDDKPEHKPVLFFAYQGKPADKGLVLNKTNADSISMDLGDETDLWMGHTLELFTMRVPFNGQMVDSIRCRVIHPQEVRQPAPAAFAPLPPLAPIGLTPTGNIPPSSTFRQQQPPVATPDSYGAIDPDIPF